MDETAGLDMNDAVREWSDKVAGRDCPFERTGDELSKDLYVITALSASTLYLERNQTYRGYCVLIYQRHIARVDQLTSVEWRQLADDLHRAQCAIWRAFSPAHINLASLGNIVPHLHWHLIPRYLDDPRWGNPIWPTGDTPKMTLQEEDYRQFADRIRTALPAADQSFT